MAQFQFTMVSARNGTMAASWDSLTPEEFIEQTTTRLTDPHFLDGKRRFAIIVERIPEGMTATDLGSIPPESSNYIQSAGSAEAMIIEIRESHGDGTYTQFRVLREPVADENEWAVISWKFGPSASDINEETVHPEEIFTGEQAAEVYRAYMERNELPAPELRRVIDI